MKKNKLVAGIVIGHPEGYGFVKRLDETGADLYLSSTQMRRVFDGDEVLVEARRHRRKDKLEAKIVSIVKRGRSELIGKLIKDNSNYYVCPENPRINQDIFVPESELNDARKGQLVSVEITDVPTSKRLAQGRVIEVLGDYYSPGIETKIAVRDYSLPYKWSQEIIESVQNLTSKISEDNSRVDLRLKHFITIDGSDARDFDDAVYCESFENEQFKLWVAIADVAEYVSQASSTDREALKRGNSVYFPNHVIPMLPERLSNDLCSLNPNEEKLVVVCEMTINIDGIIENFNFYEATIVSHARKTYDQVSRFIEDISEKDISKTFYHPSSVDQVIINLRHVYKSLERIREQRGAISFDTQETKIIFSIDKKIAEIIPIERNIAHKLIEECMLCANLCAASYLESAKAPFIYRVHKKPTHEKISKLTKFLSDLGIEHDFESDVQSSDYQRIMKKIRGMDEEKVIQSILLRSMTQAIYQPKNEGHFGLAYSSYTHFTSPIRRYSDLTVHRSLKLLIKMERDSPTDQTRIFSYSYEELDSIGEHISMTERRAEDATRSAEAWLKCEYLSHKVGESFTGVISSVTNFGLFVLLDEIFIEGLVHVTQLPGDYYVYEENHHHLIGQNSRKTFSIGKTLNVTLKGVNPRERKIDLCLND